MSRDHSQEAYDEYFSTGVDPTGGDIGPDIEAEKRTINDDLDEEEIAFYAEESEQTRAVSSHGGTLMDMLDKLEELIDKKTAEVEALERQKEAGEQRSSSSSS